MVKKPQSQSKRRKEEDEITEIEGLDHGALSDARLLDLTKTQIPSKIKCQINNRYF